jgi:hypothetical protein
MLRPSRADRPAGPLLLGLVVERVERDSLARTSLSKPFGGSFERAGDAIQDLLDRLGERLVISHGCSVPAAALVASGVRVRYWPGLVERQRCPA